MSDSPLSTIRRFDGFMEKGLLMIAEMIRKRQVLYWSSTPSLWREEMSDTSAYLLANEMFSVVPSDARVCDNKPLFIALELLPPKSAVNEWACGAVEARARLEKILLGSLRTPESRQATGISEEKQTLTDEEGVHIVRYINTISASHRSALIGCQASVMLSVSRQGHWTECSAKKFADDLKRAGHRHIVLDQSVVEGYYGRMKPFFTPEIARDMIEAFIEEAGELSFAYKNVALFSKDRGLTALNLICKTIIAHPTFPWPKMWNMLKCDFKNFQKALTLVKDTEYYGYNPDLSRVAKANYPSLFQLCMLIEKKTNPKSSFNGFANVRSAPESSILVHIVGRYVEDLKKQQLNTVPSTNYNHEQESKLSEDLNNLVQSIKRRSADNDHPNEGEGSGSGMRVTGEVDDSGEPSTSIHPVEHRPPTIPRQSRTISGTSKHAAEMQGPSTSGVKQFTHCNPLGEYSISVNMDDFQHHSNVLQ